MNAYMVHHSTGVLHLDGPDLVAEMSGRVGVFRKRLWTKLDRWPVADIRAVSVQNEELDGRPKLVLYTTTSGSQPAVAYMSCKPYDALGLLLNALVAANSKIAVTDTIRGAASELAPTTPDDRQPSHFTEKADKADRVIVQVRSVTNGLTVYTVTAERFTVKSGMLRQERTIPLRNVQEVRIEKGLTGYRVRVTSADGVIRTDRLLPNSAERLRNAILGIGDASARPSGQTLERLGVLTEWMKADTARMNAESDRRKADKEHWKALKAERDRRDSDTKS